MREDRKDDRPEELAEDLEPKPEQAEDVKGGFGVLLKPPAPGAAPPPAP